MFARIIEIDSIDEGIDRKQLIEIQQRFLKINQERLIRAKNSLAFRQQVFIDLLPLIFHTNHPALPGYISHTCPAGIYGYIPSKTALKKTTAAIRSFRLNPHTGKQNNIEAIFLMGSGGSIAQNKTSDLDVWICHTKAMSESDRKRLQEKCTKVSRWGTGLGLEVHFFPMLADDFRSGESLPFSKESSGSAQQILLLDEFYRTSLLVAGKMPLWWLVPESCKDQYDHFKSILLSRRYIPENDFIDFGPVNSVPVEEFVGAAIWQIYKAIESPYKSAIKLMLLEVYAQQYPNIQTLSGLFKHSVYFGETNADQLDPYFLMYQHIEEYLIHKGDTKRLELLRRCFYFKAGKPLTRSITSAKKSWQREFLEELVEEWNWSFDYLKKLDLNHRWKANQVVQERKVLINVLFSCYRFLLNFGRQRHIKMLIDPQEFSVLGRKLYANFGRRTEKIDWINPGISRDLHEDSIVFVEQYDEYLHETKWVACTPHKNSTSKPQAEISAATIKDVPQQFGCELVRGRYLTELLAWCHCNGILAKDTHLHLETTNFRGDERKLRQLTMVLQNWLPMPLPSVAHDTFKHSSYLKQVLFLVNVGQEPLVELLAKGHHRVAGHSDALNYGDGHENLVVTIDLISVNSWNEIEVHRFADEALLQCLVFFLRQVSEASQGKPPSFQVHCGTEGYGNTIRQRCEKLIGDILNCFDKQTVGRSTIIQPRYIFQIAQRYYCLQQRQNQSTVAEADDTLNLVRVLSNKQKYFSPLFVDSRTLSGSALQLIAGVSDSSAIQVFFSPTQAANTAICEDKFQNVIDIFILDEMGSLFTSQGIYSDEKTLLESMHRFLRNVVNRQQLSSSTHSHDLSEYPIEFYRLHANARSLRSQLAAPNSPTKDPLKYTHMERYRFKASFNDLSFLRILVTAQTSSANQMAFNIYCDDEEFTEAQHGPRLYQEVSRYILSKGPSHQPQPFYVADIDVSQCVASLSPNGQIQTNHYLELKTLLEKRISTCLQPTTPFA